jgi:hypothetical protein
MKTRTLSYGTVVLLMVVCFFFVSSHARAQTQCYYIPQRRNRQTPYRIVL